MQILILDEPTTCIDPKTRRSLWEIIKAAHQERSIFLATHSMEEAEMLGDRLVIGQVLIESE
jgi:ABC-type multidrug transport system ATPase subunit